MNIEQELLNRVVRLVKSHFDITCDQQKLQVQSTRKEFDGDFTLNVFPLVKEMRKAPEQVGEGIGELLVNDWDAVESFNVIKGFLNVSLKSGFWNKFIQGFKPVLEPESTSQMMVEYSSPNTNKPLHLGHLRNNFLGYSVAEILKAVGHPVIKTQIINDRGIHICKSMVAWINYGEGETPESSGLKGDKLVGKYYVKFDQVYKEQQADLIADGISEEEAAKNAPIMKEAVKMLEQWEQQVPAVRALWEKMNGWVYAGFEVTYTKMGVDFDKLYYESDTYLLGKKVVDEGIKQEVFHQKPDGSIWIDLSDEGLDEKLLLRGNGTAVYMTQDIGTAIERFQDFPDLTGLIYTVGDEQNYHFNVLFTILKKMGYDWAGNCSHLSYGMVELPEGKMKSREGTVVDADDLIDGMVETAKSELMERGVQDEMDEEALNTLSAMLGKGALKYYLLKVDPRKKMMFNPKESIDLNGNTAPFIQYTYARIQSILDRAGKSGKVAMERNWTEKERLVVRRLYDFESTLREAAAQYSPALVCNYTYDLVKLYNSFYQTERIFDASEEDALARIYLSKCVGDTIHQCMSLIGVEVPNRM